MKIQNPQAEKTFKVDIETAISFARLAMPPFVTVLSEIKKQFLTEFDYRLEAANLRRVVDDVLPLCERSGLRVRFPAPFDAHHPKLPPAEGPCSAMVWP